MTRNPHCWLGRPLPTVAACAALALPALSTTAVAQADSSQAGTQPTAPALRVDALHTEYHVNPVGIDTRAPRLSWTLRADRRGTLQRAYEVRVSDDSAALSTRPLWISGHVASDASTFRPYQGPALRSRTRYVWQVRAWDDQGHASDWSAPAYWETGLLSPADWRARWIVPDLAEDTTGARSNPSPMLRSDFTVHGPVASARAYVTSHGLYDMEINGRRVGDRLFTPGWTSYDTRVQYQTYDVTDLLTPGANAVGVTLGDGWYRGRLGFQQKRNTYGTQLALRAQIVVRYTDGREETFGTGEGWRSSTGPIRMSDTSTRR